MKTKIIILFLIVCLMSLYFSIFHSQEIMIINYLGFFGLPVSVIVLGADMFSRATKIDNKSKKSNAVGVITIGVVLLVIIILLSLVAISWNDK